MYSFEYTPLYNFIGIQFLPNESLKRELKFSFKPLINCSFMKISKNLLFKTVQEMANYNFLKLIELYIEVNWKFKSKKLIYSFKMIQKYMIILQLLFSSKSLAKSYRIQIWVTGGPLIYQFHPWWEEKIFRIFRWEV